MKKRKIPLSLTALWALLNNFYYWINCEYRPRDIMLCFPVQHNDCHCHEKCRLWSHCVNFKKKITMTKCLCLMETKPHVITSFDLKLSNCRLKILYKYIYERVLQTDIAQYCKKYLESANCFSDLDTRGCFVPNPFKYWLVSPYLWHVVFQNVHTE